MPICRMSREESFYMNIEGPLRDLKGPTGNTAIVLGRLVGKMDGKSGGEVFHLQGNGIVSLCQFFLGNGEK